MEHQKVVIELEPIGEIALLMLFGIIAILSCIMLGNCIYGIFFEKPDKTMW